MNDGLILSVVRRARGIGSVGTVEQPVLKKIASKRELGPGSGKIVVLDDKPIALFNIGGNYFALDNTCPHRGGSLGDGEVDGEIVTCPWHGWNFNVETGEDANNPSLCLTKYDIKVNGEDIELTLYP